MDYDHVLSWDQQIINERLEPNYHKIDPNAVFAREPMMSKPQKTLQNQDSPLNKLIASLKPAKSSFESDPTPPKPQNKEAPAQAQTFTITLSKDVIVIFLLFVLIIMIIQLSVECKQLNEKVEKLLSKNQS